MCHLDDIIARKEAAGRQKDRESLPGLRSFRKYLLGRPNGLRDNRPQLHQNGRRCWAKPIRHLWGQVWHGARRSDPPLLRTLRLCGEDVPRRAEKDHSWGRGLRRSA